VRNDLSIAQQAVQAGHAAIEYVDTYGTEELNGYLIYLVVEGKEQLMFWWRKLSGRLYNIAPFHEPDLNNEMTAVACAADDSDNVFSGLKLMGE
jgi:hypothetical protein